MVGLRSLETKLTYLTISVLRLDFCLLRPATASRFGRGVAVIEKAADVLGRSKEPGSVGVWSHNKCGRSELSLLFHKVKNKGVAKFKLILSKP